MSATCCESDSGSNGFTNTAFTPRSAKRERSVACTFAVSSITGICAVAGFFCNSRKVAGPSMPGIITSSRIASGWYVAARASPCAPELATITSHPATVSRLSAATSRISSSSSMIRMRCMNCFSEKLRTLAGGNFRNGLLGLLRTAQHGQYKRFQLLRLNAGFRQEVTQPKHELHSLRLGQSMRGVGYQRRFAQILMLAQPIHYIEAVAIRHPNVQNNHMRLERKAIIQRRLPRIRNVHNCILSAEDLADHLSQLGIVFHNQDACLLTRNTQHFYQLFQQKIIAGAREQPV